MRVWRICRQPYVSHALDGLGGLYASGRWHSQGNPIVYTATSPALAALEVLVQVDPLTAPADLSLLAIDLPANLSMENLEADALPQNWAAVPAPKELQLLGSSWLLSTRTAALSVPSAVIHLERNILINPNHPEAAGISLSSVTPFTFDPRLFTRR